MANSQHIPGLIRGHDGTIVMVEHGQFERTTDFITVKPEFARAFNRETKEMTRKPISPNYKFGLDEIKIPVEKQDMMYAHVDNFLKCMRSREKPHLDVETAYGRVRVKTAAGGTASPEYADCRRLALSTAQPLQEIPAAPMAAHRNKP